MKYAVLALVAIATGGCATVTRGTTSQVQVVSVPEQAEARTSLGASCTTPCTLTVSRKDEFSVSISLPGYETETVLVRTQVAGSGAAGFAGNLILGGVVGMAADAATGATLEHVPNPVRVDLKPVHRTPARPAPRGKGRKPAPAGDPVT